ncbi:MAG TPA: diaminopimelate epimerase [Rhabdochlamydiaceae bacterium]|nr:diaminopimelate epimerase [Rhabdochlamydiaceae bacterium]
MNRYLVFSKYQGAGNDFIVIDDRDLAFPIHDKKCVQKLSNRTMGIGADGIILLQPSTTADFQMRILNADGSEPAMCGNGIRCLVHFIRSLGYTALSYRIETGHSMAVCRFEGEKILVSQKLSSTVQEVQLELGRIFFLNTGVPHAIVFKNEIQDIDVEKLGREIRFHPHFAPEGANVSFAKIAGNEVEVRTYERGVERETAACGTAAAAVAIATHCAHQLNSPIRYKIVPRSKEPIEVIVNTPVVDDKIEVQVVGDATFVYEGKIPI